MKVHCLGLDTDVVKIGNYMSRSRLPWTAHKCFGPREVHLSMLIQFYQFSNRATESIFFTVMRSALVNI